MTEQTPEQFTNADSFAKILAEAQGAEAVAQPEQATPEEGEAKGQAEAPPTEPPEGGADFKQDDAPEEPEQPVPPARLKKEIEKRRAAEEKAAALQQQVEAMNGLIGKELKGEAKEEVSLDGLDPLDPDTTKMLLAEIRSLKAELNETKQSTTATSFSIAAQRQKAEFERANPDFDAAIEHLGRAEAAKFEAVLGDPEEAARAATAAMGQIVAACHKQGKNVAETLYKMAKAAGYQGKKEAPKVDLARLEENKKRTATVATIPAATAAPNPIGVYATKEGFKEHLLDGKGRVDGDKFQKVLKKIHDNADRVAV